MALQDYDQITWTDINNLFRRVVSERGRWNGAVGSSVTKPKLNGVEVTLANNPGASTFNARGVPLSASDVDSWRQTLLALVNSSATQGALSSFKAALSTRAGIELRSESVGPQILLNLKTVLNNARTAKGYDNTTAQGTVSTGFSAHATSQSYWDSGYGEVWAFAVNGGCFGHSGSKSFGFTINNTAHNPNCVNCTSGFTSNSSNFAAGFCSSYYSDAI